MRIGYVVATTVFVMLGCARGPNVSTDALPLRRVVVYRNGVGYFERSGRVDADQVKFRMRQRMVGDFLASLAIVERGGSSVRSASFPLDIRDEAEPEPPPPPGIESLLKPLPPAPEKRKDPGELMREVMLALDGREHELAIGYVVETPVWKPSYRVVVREGGGAELQAWGIVQNVSGEDWREVRLALVAGAPIAFQSTLGDAVVPNRPIITDQGEVIAAVPEGVTSLEQKPESAAERYGAVGEAAAEPATEVVEEGYAYEDESEPEMDRAASGGALRASKPKKKSAARPSAAPAPPPSPITGADEQRRAELSEIARAGLSAPRRMSALAAVAVESGTTRYDIPEPVTVPDKSATMVLLVSKSVPGEAVFLFSPDPGVPESSAHPFRVVRFQNATAGLLERGPIAVFEKGSFLGQGLLDPLPPGAKATVPFALERALAIAVERRVEERGARLHKIEAGEIWVERDSVTKTTYKAKNGGAELAKLLVKHPRTPETRLYQPPAGTEDNTGLGNALVPLEVKGHGRSELVVDERRGMPQRTEWLTNLADEAVKSYIGDRRANPQAVKQLAQAWQLREAWRVAYDELRRLELESRQIDAAAHETRSSLKAIEKNTQAADLRAKLTQRLAELTTRQEQLTKRLVEVRMGLSEKEIRFREAIRELAIRDVPPPVEGS